MRDVNQNVDHFFATTDIALNAEFVQQFVFAAADHLTVLCLY